MKHCFSLLLVCVVFSNTFYAQSRVAFDFNSILKNGYVSLQYCPVFKQHYYMKNGITWGLLGRKDGYKESPDFSPTSQLVCPYSELNELVFTGKGFRGFFSELRAVGLETGVGRVWIIDAVHSFRADFQLKAYLVQEDVVSYFDAYDPEDTSLVIRHSSFQRVAISVGPEFFHAIRISTRFTMFYGFKLPWFLPLRTTGYRPMDLSFTKGLRPVLSLGMSYAIKEEKGKRVNRNRDIPDEVR